jgi:hypothetical protein
MDGILGDQRRIALSGAQTMARQNKAEIVLTARNRTRAAFQQVNQQLGRFATIGLAGAAAGVALLTRASLKNIDALAKQSQLLGTSIAALAAMQLAAAKTGVETKTLEKSLINMTRVIAEAATGTGLAVDTLKKLGLEAESLSRMRPEEQFDLIADAMAGLNTQSEKVLAAYELFGGRGAALLRTLEAGSAAMDEAREKTKRFGTALTAVDAKGVEDANDAFTDMSEALKGVGFDLARRFAPGMEAASTSTANFLVTIRRDFIPAMALMLERMKLVENNVRGLSDIELAVRVELQGDKVTELKEDLEDALAPAKTLFTILGQDIKLDKIVDPEAIQAEIAAAEERLAAVREEQARRTEVILEAERKREEQLAAQREEARLKAEEVEAEADREAFGRKLEAEQERQHEFIQMRLERAREFRRIAFAEAKAEQQALISAGKQEAAAARNTIAIRQATARTSIQIGAVLAAKSKTVSQAIFLVEKGLAIATTIQNTAAASVRALAELGPIAGPPAAAAIQAFGAAQVGLIAATALTGVGSVGGGGISGIGGGGLDSTGAGGGDFGDQEQFGGGGTPTQEQGVVQLIFPSLFGITPDAVDALAEALREASENRDIIVVSGSGRNSELLTGTNG